MMPLAPLWKVLPLSVDGCNRGVYSKGKKGTGKERNVGDKSSRIFK